MRDPNQGQSDKSIEKNISFFRDNLDEYNQKVQQLDTYVILKSYINRAISGISNLLDIGNGGVFDYDVTLVNNITGLDLFLDKLPSSFTCPPNVTLKTGSALNIPEKDNHFDGVLIVMLIHHLIGKTVKSSIQNMEKTIQESYRVLKPGGRMILVESCVPRWFYQFEKMVFPVASRIINKVSKHPATIQYPASFLHAFLEKTIGKTKIIPVPLGRWVMIYGHKVPSILTPVQPTLFIANKK